jgi:hypothetical protein
MNGERSVVEQKIVKGPAGHAGIVAATLVVEQIEILREKRQYGSDGVDKKRMDWQDTFFNPHLLMTAARHAYPFST